MKIITGGAGFIGSAVLWKLNKMGVTDILIVDSDIDGTKKNNLESLKYTEFIDKQTFLKDLKRSNTLKKADTMYHMGACSSTTEQNMDYLTENNVEYSKELAKWSLTNNVRFIYASSAATYGDGEFGFDDNRELIPKLKPLNKYGLSKQMFDMWVLENGYEKKFAGLKYFNVFGPNENHKGEMRSMVNKSYHRIKETGELHLFKSYRPQYKNGEQMRDFLYIKDAVDMTIFFDANLTPQPPKGSANGIFNIGSGKPHTWIQLANAIFKALDMEPKIIFVDMPDNIKDQYQYFSEANITKLKDAGYSGEIMSLEEGVKDYVQNYLVPDKYLL